ncbi:F-box/kelch-repeat protein At1g57790-like [Macadamia integrifolia]|uniref:F-box/kelch-repeat protein At1g57790-like n=1 Tax=Macadamia integrifolia TaxID=60698 RepID=UPI001C52C58E|nr:F-box/kelch-repeat protein At1g57790-like [Macadamia integrifolia]
MEMEKFAAFTHLKHYKKKSKNSKREDRSWSDLPTEILEHIMADLYLSDITSFHEVCKQWSSIERPRTQLLIRYGYEYRHRCRSMNQIPWLLMSNLLVYDVLVAFLQNSHTHLTSSCTLIVPSSSSSSSSSKKTYSIKIEGIGPNDDTQVCSTKFGWLLLSQTHPYRTTFFLYSPFTNERIDLPDLDSKFDVATFSSVPTSTDCIFFVLHYTTKVTISICRQGDKAWSSSSFSNGFSLIKDVVYSKGLFYCSTIRGALAAFDVSQRSWRVLSEFRPLLDSSCYDYSSFMVGDVEEELLFILLSNSGGWALVHKLDRSVKMWVKVENLTDKSLFVSSASTSVMVSKNKRTERVMNRVYHCLPNEPPKFYSLKGSKSYISSSTYGDLPNKEFPKKFIWIEPPC